MTSDFPPGEVGQQFNHIGEPEEGEFVYVRMQVFRSRPDEFDRLQLKLVTRPATAAFGAAWQVLMVARSQIVCREPRAMEADGGIVKGIA